MYYNQSARHDVSDYDDSEKNRTDDFRAAVHVYRFIVRHLCMHAGCNGPQVAATERNCTIPIILIRYSTLSRHFFPRCVIDFLPRKKKYKYYEGSKWTSQIFEERDPALEMLLRSTVSCRKRLTFPENYDCVIQKKMFREKICDKM